MADKKEWTVEFTEQARKAMARDPETAAFVRETTVRIRQAISDFEAGRIKSLDEAFRAIGMEPAYEDLFEEDD